MVGIAPEALSPPLRGDLGRRIEQIQTDAKRDLKEFAEGAIDLMVAAANATSDEAKDEWKIEFLLLSDVYRLRTEQTIRRVIEAVWVTLVNSVIETRMTWP